MEFIIKGGVLTEAKNAQGRVEIPLGTVKIARFAFSDSLIEEVVIPAGVVEISARAFDSCVNLKRVVLPDTLTKIGHGAFFGCSALSDINFPSSLEA